MKNLKNYLFLLVVAVSSNIWALDLKQEALLIDSQTQSSSTAVFMNLTGWMNKGLLAKKRVNLNHAIERSPNPEEFNSVQDSFAINYEFFKNDPEFKCRRPTYYNYFSKLLKTAPFENFDCKMNHQVTLVSESMTSGNLVVARNIDPQRIYQIHYLFAGKGKQMMSRWGHSMFRLILCAPGKPVGPSCLNDYSEHVVVSYRANVEDMNLDYRKGMNGSYDSQLFLMNMSEVVKEYTKGEFRDMTSLPIQMNREEMALFTNKLLENYWSYKGRYYFLTNNCATESMNLLRSAFPENNKIQTADIVTPLGLYKFLIKNKMVNPDLLNDKKEASRMGYFFPGVSEKLQKSLELFVGPQQDSEGNDLELSFNDFALKTSPENRKYLYGNKLNEVENDSRISILANALRLEEQILQARELVFAKKLGDALFGKTPMPQLQSSDLKDQIVELKNLYTKLTKASYLAPGYGIPLENEFKLASSEDIKAVLELIKGKMDSLKQAALNFFPKEVEDMKQTLENIQWIKEQLK